jgi:hypothetical protein
MGLSREIGEVVVRWCKVVVWSGARIFKGMSRMKMIAFKLLNF